MGKGQRILLADSKREVRDAVERLGHEYGYHIVQATTAAEIWKSALGGKLDLIVLDVTLPDADGRDLLAQLKKDPRTARIPVLIWSARDPESDRRIALDLGAEDYMEKGPPQDLCGKIQRLLLRLEEG